MSYTPDYLRQYTRRKAKQYGLDPNIEERQFGQESGFKTGRTSSAGALGVAQIMPATAAAWGVDPNDPKAALDAAIRHMAEYRKKYGSMRNALIAYNAGPGRVGSKSLPAETQQYLKIILGQSGAGDSSRVSSHTSMLGGISGSTQDTSSAPSVFDVIRQYREATQPQTPGVAGSDPLALTPLSVTMDKLNSIKEASNPAPSPALSPTSALGGIIGGKKGKVTISPNANKPGTKINSAVTGFISTLSGRLGTPLEIGTGTNHSTMTVNGNVSEHTTGNAADVPLAGKALIRAGQQALIEAGMDPAEARKQTGGLFNVQTKRGRYQIIFNTHIGGDHTNHLHVGFKPNA